MYDPNDLPIDPSLATDPGEMDALGLLPNSVTPEPYGVSWDPKGSKAAIDLGYIGCDSSGVWARRHPEVILNDHPRLWGIFDQLMHYGAPSQPDPEWSSFEYEAWNIIRGVTARFRGAKSDGE